MSRVPRPHPPLVVEVSGPLACFTRPELKAERVSYPVMTPSAASGLLEAILWKPEFRWDVTQIEVLQPVRWFTFRRNEVKSVLTEAKVRELRRKPGVRYDVEQDRDQRSTVALRDVAYRIHAHVDVLAKGVREAKYRDMFRRRVERGACFSEPFLGCREFSATFGPASDRAPIDRDDELGVMLHSIAYTPRGEEYRWFRASMVGGVVEVPDTPLAASAVDMPTMARRAEAAEGA
ncbi:type I-C CRISPR-associated protein Cas5c [Yinghuangia sp. ASG 101]|uniref:type I-C CRISPR-associated protein Cas5c n=1 Tax=Yinghuangia sp. ASG 101 TaxID=2896848 RepID=UPI001E32D23E|nr:type I-C CRISPR-associated protein Cas5c [Yinghuangia sp. ASG 101]UGQ14974.1 type I-C CRISPR-associated protein Cas5c [Yinghuangia sp. ASG 101]